MNGAAAAHAINSSVREHTKSVRGKLNMVVGDFFIVSVWAWAGTTSARDNAIRSDVLMHAEGIQIPSWRGFRALARRRHIFVRRM
jgi:hypothetical protein